MELANRNLIQSKGFYSMANYIDVWIDRDRGLFDDLPNVYPERRNDCIAVCYHWLREAGVDLKPGQKKLFRVTFTELPMGSKSDLASKRKPPAKKLKRRYKLKPGFPVNLQSGRKK